MALGQKSANLYIKLKADVKDLEKKLARAKKKTSVFSKQVKSLGLAMAGAFGGAALLRGIGMASKKNIEFEQSMADVKAITQATAMEFDQLSQDALKLGAATEWTASQVALLQKAYGKLGFTTQEILAATEATVDLATATGEDLAGSAAIAAGVLNSFNLGADDTERIVDVMARSFTSSALDLERFGSAMSNVGATAKAMGYDIEYTTALMSVLVDSNIDASKAGTDLRKIFAVLASEGMTLNEALDYIEGSTNKVKTAQELFGQRAFTSAIILKDQREKVEELTKSYRSSEGAAKDMAAIQRDTVGGALKKLQSAWSGLVLKFQAAKGAMQGLILGLTSILGFMGRLILPTKKQSDMLEEQRTRMNLLAIELTSANTKEKDRKRILDELKKINPDIVEGIDAEALSYDQLRINLDKVNSEMLKRIALQRVVEKLDEAKADRDKVAASIEEQRGEIAVKINKQVEKYTKLNAGLGAKARNIATSPFMDLRSKISALDHLGREYNKTLEQERLHGKQISINERATTDLRFASTELLRRLDELQKANADVISVENELAELEKILGIGRDDLATATGDAADEQGKLNKHTEEYIGLMHTMYTQEKKYNPNQSAVSTPYQLPSGFGTPGLIGGLRGIPDVDLAGQMAKFENGAKSLGDTLASVGLTGADAFGAIGSAIDKIMPKADEMTKMLLMTVLRIGMMLAGGGGISGLGGILLGGLQSFGTGGYVTSPTLAMVGESGPEYIIPASQMTAAGGGSTVEFGEVRVDNKAIYISYKNYLKKLDNYT